MCKPVTIGGKIICIYNMYVRRCLHIYLDNRYCKEFSVFVQQAISRHWCKKLMLPALKIFVVFQLEKHQTSSFWNVWLWSFIKFKVVVAKARFDIVTEYFSCLTVSLKLYNFLLKTNCSIFSAACVWNRSMLIKLCNFRAWLELQKKCLTFKSL